MRALAIYPLNALIDSQRERLSDWTSPFKGKIRFCLYNGETPDKLRLSERNARPRRSGTARRCGTSRRRSW